jgi:hypothetical protein
MYEQQNHLSAMKSTCELCFLHSYSKLSSFIQAEIERLDGEGQGPYGLSDVPDVSMMLELLGFELFIPGFVCSTQ